MSRLVAVVAVSLAIGAGVMYGLSNFRLRVEPVGGEPPPVALAPAPAPLAPPPVVATQLPQSPAVVQASHTAPAPLPATVVAAAVQPPAPVPAKPALPIRVTKVEDALGVTWDVSAADNQGRVYLIGTTPKLQFNLAPAKAGLQVFVNNEGGLLEPKTDAAGAVVTPANEKLTLAGVALNNGKLELDLRKLQEHFPTAASQAELVVELRSEKPQDVLAQVTLVRPMAVTTGSLPVIVDQYRNSPHLDPASLPGGDAKVQVYGSYLSLLGRSFGRAGQLKFVAIIEGGNPFELTDVQVLTDPSGTWSARLTLPNYGTGASGKLAVRIETPDGHFYHTRLIGFEYVARPTAVAPPTEIAVAAPSADFKVVPAAQASASGLHVYLANTSAVKVTVTPPPGANAVRLYVDRDAPVRTVAVTEQNKAGVLFDSVPLGPGRTHVVRADAVFGDQPSATVQVEVRVQTSRPVVESVSSPGFGAGGDSDKVAIRFSAENKFDPTEAKKGEHYEVYFNETTPVTTSSTPTKLGGFDYDEVTNTVALTLLGVKPGSYTVVVKDSLADVYGNAVTVVPGLTSRRAYQTVLYTTRVDTPLPSESAGVTLQTGPNVEFEEYTKFRKLQDGFNPSDRVETRVVRLYYNRDANRVAQIVNRDVKSYNVAAVDVRRRAADRVRDEANMATDERQRLERAAVQAAVEARAAERELQALEARAAEAGGQTAVSQVEIRRKEEELAQARRDLEAAELLVRTRAEVDPSADDQRARSLALQQQVDQLNADIAELKRFIASADVTAERRRTAERIIQEKELELAKAKADLARATASVPNNVATTRTVQDQEAVVDRAEVAVAAARRKLAAATAEGERKAAESELIEKEEALASARRELSRRVLAAQNTEEGKLEQGRAVIATLDLEVRKQERIINAADTTAAEKAKAEAQLRDLNGQLAQARLEYDRAVALSKARAATDSSATVDPIRRRVERLEGEVAQYRRVQANAEATQRSAADQIAAARGRLQAAREAEVKADEASKVKAAEELRLREHQFRREVAAAKEDPDIYAAGKPDSLDPVRQCSISVIGEGLIQIRGPIKGLNVIRTMINQLDSPVGQVRVNVHTVQVNGERADRMERVVASIQRYLDASRFLTEQSSQMLRKAVTVVASRKAEEAAAFAGPNCAQADRDLKYLHAFFGKDFIDELRTLDSEFLKTGNKLLSLHSMDSTSLSAAMFLLALAKNEVRREILMEFQAALQRELPVAEMTFYRAGLSGGKCEACFDKKFYVLAYNAQFPSFLGFFNGEVQGTDTLTPIQREFVRLAQIFKSRLVTELQLKQRVMERSLLEERIGKDYLAELRKAAALEDAAKAELAMYRDKLRKVTAESQTSIFQLLASAEQVQTEVRAALEIGRGFADEITTQAANVGKVRTAAPQTKVKVGAAEYSIVAQAVDEDPNAGLTFDQNGALIQKLEALVATLGQFYYQGQENYLAYREIRIFVEDVKNGRPLTDYRVTEFRKDVKAVSELLNAESERAKQQLQRLALLLSDDRPNPAQAFVTFQAFRDEYLGKLREGAPLKTRALTIFKEAEPTFKELVQTATRAQAAQASADARRRPLDEKKLLDMLVDEVEDKFIELLEGTRAHTANVDNYLKALATSLETDFNTQFYQPAFRQVREASRARDVAFAQVETTTVLANNRAFAKVSPKATMEFDLPKRDILVTEAFKSAKAAVDEYGALLSDPSFLALTRMYSGLPVASQAGGSGGLSAVRNVLPGLPGSADEMILAQAGPGRKEFGAAFEALIPDPAIYKIETGTGYEIRPVLSPDGQNVVFNFNYMYTTDLREPVRADEKHLGRVKRHFVNTDVQLSNYELREVSKYQVGLKASRTSKGVQLLEDIPGVGVLFRPLPSAESSLQQNLIYAQSTIFPTLFDLMGLRYAPAVADLDPAAYVNDEWVVRNRRRDLEQRIFDVGATRVDEALRIPHGERRPDLYRSQESIPYEHPNGYSGPGLRLRDSYLREGHPDEYDPRRAYPETPFTPRGHVPRPADPLFGPFGHSAPGDSGLPPGAVILPGGPPVTIPPPAPQPLPGSTLPTPRPGGAIPPRPIPPPPVGGAVRPTIPPPPVIPTGTGR